MLGAVLGPALRSALLAFLLASAAAADTLRVATFDVGLTRDGAGVLLRDLADPDPTTAAIATVIRAVRPDVLLLTGFDTDLRGRALAAFAALLDAGPDGIDYPHASTPRSTPANPLATTSTATGGRWAGTTASAGASSPATAAWRSCRGCRSTPRASGPSACCAGPTCRAPNCRCAPTARRSPTRRRRRRSGCRRARTGTCRCWRARTRLHLLAASPTPPLFDGAEGFNRLRNRDELRLWSAYLDGAALRDDAGREASLSAGPLVLLGNLNLDPFDGAGAREAIAGLLAHPRLQDPRPTSRGGAVAGPEGVNGGHDGDPALDTADWRDDGQGPGNLRVDYVLPSADLEVTAAGVFWPAAGEPLADAAATASAHRLVWVDLVLP